MPFRGGRRAGFDLAEGADERERKRPSAPRRAEKLGKRIPLVGDPGKAEEGFLSHGNANGSPQEQRFVDQNAGDGDEAESPC
jgi:hypothetical protein